MYESFYGLRERPFDLTPNPRFLYLTAGHKEALSNLEYGIIGRKGMTLLIGEAGTGKTTIVRAALEAVAGPSVKCVYLSNPVLTREEFYEFLAPKFGLSERAATSKAKFLSELEEILLARHQAGGLTALVIDEAQSLPHELLEEVRLLANFETTTDKLLPVVLAGQPELAARLEHEELRQLKQRVALRCDLAALDFHETAAYIAGRVSIAGGDSPRIFRREAVQTIFERSRGIPRTISVICDNALLSGFADGVKPIGSDLVLEVCRDFRLPQFKLTELRTAAPPSNGHGTRPPNVVMPEPPDDAPGARADPPLRRPDEGMFSHYTKKKRFSFFG
jgi:general secretion pathway protein A